MSDHIVVGIDDSSHARAALSWAIEEAVLRGASIELVHGVGVTPMEDIPFEPALLIDAGEAVLDRVLADVDASRLPAPPLRTVELASPAGLLLDKAEQADLVVVGARGRGGFGALLIGSVTSTVVHHASCPVVVVR